MEAILAEWLYHDAVTPTHRVHIDELDDPGGITRLKILDDLAEECTKMGNIFKMIKTVTIMIISTFNTIDPRENRPTLRALAQNSVEDMIVSMVACEEFLDQITTNETKSRKASEVHPDITNNLDKVSETELIWLKNKTLGGTMVATRNAIDKTLSNINTIKT
jgi:hypothetical protein